MDFEIEANLNEPRQLIRRAGYAEFRDPNTGETSYVRRLAAGNFYPRFHVYLMTRGDKHLVSLHLDQKKPSYGVGHAHSGEYSGRVVEEEAVRIKQAIARELAAPEDGDNNDGEEKKSFFSRFFGSK